MRLGEIGPHGAEEDLEECRICRVIFTLGARRHKQQTRTWIRWTDLHGVVFGRVSVSDVSSDIGLYEVRATFLSQEKTDQSCKHLFCALRV